MQLEDFISFLQSHGVAVEKEWLRWVSKEGMHPRLDEYEVRLESGSDFQLYRRRQFLYHVLPSARQRKFTKILADPSR